jgi:hypothetical protein
MFDEKGPLKVQGPIYSNNPYIGRIDANGIPPPHNVSSLVRCICAKEGKGSSFDTDWDNGDVYSAELFETVSSPNALDPQKPLSLLSTDRPGSRPEDPLALKVVYTGMFEVMIFICNFYSLIDLS